MKTQFSKERLTRMMTKIFVTLLIAFPTTEAVAHQWQINGKQVEAELVDYNQTHVLLRNKKGVEKSFPITQLHEDDLDYLTKLVAIRDSRNQERFQNQLIRKQQFELLSRTSDTWNVAMTSPNGQYFTRTVFANNSAQAVDLAMRQFPAARFMGVRKQSGRFN